MWQTVVESAAIRCRVDSCTLSGVEENLKILSAAQVCSIAEAYGRHIGLAFQVNTASSANITKRCYIGSVVHSAMRARVCKTEDMVGPKFPRAF
jgi:hypothetical protein